MAIVLHDIMQFLLSQQSLMPSVKKYDKNEALAEFFILSTTGYPASYGIDIGLYKGT